ncbi:MAG: uroporphyrinogen-III synthase, partial [Prevotella sp.]|nr:uroporphyrinogen-III synthase [Prevotella sp.]
VSIGSTTTAALQKARVKEVQQVDDDNSYGVIAWFRRQPCGRVIIPRSNLALPIIPEGLKELGFKVDCITAYINRMPAHPQKICLDEVDRIVFTSPSTIDNFISLYGSLPVGKIFATRGPVTEQYLHTIIKQQNL